MQAHATAHVTMPLAPPPPPYRPPSPPPRVYKWCTSVRLKDTAADGIEALAVFRTDDLVVGSALATELNVREFNFHDPALPYNNPSSKTYVIDRKRTAPLVIELGADVCWLADPSFATQCRCSRASSRRTCASAVRGRQ